MPPFFNLEFRRGGKSLTRRTHPLAATLVSGHFNDACWRHGTEIAQRAVNTRIIDRVPDLFLRGDRQRDQITVRRDRASRLPKSAIKSLSA
jgi:hypothetical protein